MSRISGNIHDGFPNTMVPGYRPNDAKEKRLICKRRPRHDRPSPHVRIVGVKMQAK